MLFISITTDGVHSRSQATDNDEIAQLHIGHGNTPCLASGSIDGDIGPGSRSAIRNYQADRGLAPTGRIDSALLRSLGAGVPAQWRTYATHVTGRVFQDTGHWITEERSKELTEAISTFVDR